MWFECYPCLTFILTSLISVSITKEHVTSPVKYDPLYSEVLNNITQVNKDLKELITLYEEKFKEEKTKVPPEDKYDKVFTELINKLDLIIRERSQDISRINGNKISKKANNKLDLSDDTSDDFSSSDGDSEVIIIANGDKNNLNKANAKTRRESRAMRDSLNKLLAKAQEQTGDVWFDFMETGLRNLENNNGNEINEEKVTLSDDNDSAVGNDSVVGNDIAIADDSVVGNDIAVADDSAVGNHSAARNESKQEDTKVIANVFNSEESIKLEEDESNMLRTAYAEACAKVVIRKCYKALTRTLINVCEKPKCKKGFKKHFKEKAKTGCLEFFEAKDNTEKDEEKDNKQFIHLYPLIGQPVVPFSEDFYITCFPSTKLRAANSSIARTQNSTQETNITVKTDEKSSKLTEKTIEFSNQIQSLRTNLEQLCQKVSVDKCFSACKFAATGTCEESQKKCTRSRQKLFKKTCTKQCKSSFMGADDDSDTDSEDSDDDDDDDDDDDSDDDDD